MKLFDIMCNTRYELVQGGNADITGLTIDSRRVSRGSMFFCIKGLKSDGHMFVPDAIGQNAAAIVVEEYITAPEHVTVIRVSDTRAALACAAANFYGWPAEDMTLIGVTGTNGKTSTTYFMESILTANHKKSGIIGTVEFRIGSEKLDIHTATSTTPDTIELQQILCKMREANVDYTVMEVTSHALALKKTDGMRYKVGIFTNLTQDHLDFHGSMDEYCRTKAKLFGVCEYSVINADDPYAERMIRASAGRVVTYSIDNPSDLKAENVRLKENGCSFTLLINGAREEFFIPVRGRFSVYNSLGVVGAALCLGIAPAVIRTGLERISGVPGRIQSVENDHGIGVVVDYSHTPDSLRNIIITMREVTKGRVITVFGCGGDRDRTKRPIMGRIAGELSDYCVITSDNPRTEDPVAIVDEVETGMKQTRCGYEKVVDRRQAIEHAVAIALPGDSIIIAGKGHENYQIFADRTVHFDDREEAEVALKKISLFSMTLGEIARATGGRCEFDPTIRVRGVSTDTRTLAPGNLFFAIKGDNFDGHDYLPQAFAAGAAACVSEKSADGAVIHVGSVAKALRDLAEYHRRKYRLPVVAITGSTGKTTTKDMIASVLSQKYNLLKTEGNFNNEIGLPLTVLKLTNAHECAVFEMGMNHIGEISNLSRIARPDICVITNIGMAHIEYLGSQENILKAKAEIFDYMAPDGLAVLNGDDTLLNRLTTPLNRMYYGFGRHDVYADNIRVSGLTNVGATVHYEDMSFEITVPQQGRHMVLNALAAVSVGLKLGLSISQIQRGIASFIPSGNRMDIFDSPWGFTVINDSYNASPDSMKAALEVLSQHPGPNACILGDMRELGDFSEASHRDVGRYAADLGIDTIIFIGPLSFTAYREAQKRRLADDLRPVGVFHFYDKARMLPHLRDALRCKTLLVKGSRAMQLEEIVEIFKD